MRITTQMLNESARKTGLPVNGTSLLNYINNDDRNNNSLLSALNKKTTSVFDVENKKKYEKLGKEADKLTDSASVLQQERADNLFTQAKESGNNQKIYDSIENFFKNYNSTVKALKNTSDTMNNFYRQMLSDAAKEAEESLSGIGITFHKDGSANVDMDKVKKSDMETLENLFGSKSDFVSKVNFISTRISDNAEANVKSFSSSYSSNGTQSTWMSGSGSGIFNAKA